MNTDTLKKENKSKRKHFTKYNKKFTDDEIDRIADDMYEWFQDESHLWLKDFATERMIHRQRISEFCKKSDYFNYIYTLCMSIQESRVIKLGLNKKINVAIPIMILKNNHHWTDK